MNNIYRLPLIFTFLLVAACSSEPQSRDTETATTIIGSSTTVLINGLPAAKELVANLDCGSLQDQIGSTNVMINGQPAARQTEELLKLCQSVDTEESMTNVKIGD